MSESERFSGRRIGKAPTERSNFAQACTLLSQFLKEKRNLSVGTSGNTETKETFLPSVTTKNFLTSMKSQAGGSTQNAVVAPPTAKPSSDFVQKLVGFGAEDSKKADLRKSTSTTVIAKPESSQMTIFYSGQVLVFNDLPADRANEIIALARQGSSNISGSVSEPVVNIEIIDLSKSVSPEPEPTNVVASVILPPNTNKSDITINTNNNKHNNNIKQKTHDQRPSEPASGSDLPIARRNSLHRFLEKRKDRVASKAPYQAPNRGGGLAAATGMAPPKPEEGSSKEGGCSDDQHLELKL